MPHKRKTARLESALQSIAYAEGGETGSRTAYKLGMEVSPDTMLRQIRNSSLTAALTPKVLGVKAHPMLYKLPMRESDGSAYKI